ncbi:hypothetical protein ACFV6Z_14910 [Streptomyces sp. NPDC059818]|uniref:hypothetical protein n=1 Tax=Streptomyces sp. NPDC059818 TaxID=3346962 RepID=UPI003665E5A1
MVPLPQGGVLGTLRRIPPRRPFRHTWRIDQPGRPEIVGRDEWAAGDSAAEAVGRVAVKAAGRPGRGRSNGPWTVRW